jgi:hypothetical protein
MSDPIDVAKADVEKAVSTSEKDEKATVALVEKDEKTGVNYIKKDGIHVVLLGATAFVTALAALPGGIGDKGIVGAAVAGATAILRNIPLFNK